MIVYHGGLEIIKKPDVAHSYRCLDFGKGFYVTAVRVQAEKWVRRKADILDRDFAIVNQINMLYARTLAILRLRPFRRISGTGLILSVPAGTAKLHMPNMTLLSAELPMIKFSGLWICIIRASGIGKGH